MNGIVQTHSWLNKEPKYGHSKQEKFHPVQIIEIPSDFKSTKIIEDTQKPIMTKKRQESKLRDTFILIVRGKCYEMAIQSPTEISARKKKSSWAIKI